jgi:hypothetical protein
VQSVSALVLLVGLTWFDVFERRATNYVLALAFLAFAAHWVAMGVTRIRGASTELEAWMGIPLAAVAALAAWTFFAANNTGYAIGFGLLFCVYVADSLRAFHAFAGADRVQGAVQFVTGLWMIYLTYAVVLGVTR